MYWRDIHRTTVVVTAPAAAISATLAKAFLQVDHTTDDTLITSLITAATEQVESDTNRTLLATVFDLWFDRFPSGRVIELSRSPVSAISSVKSYNDSDTEATLATTNYFADLKSEPGRVVLVDAGSWPSDLRPANAGVVRFTAGYTTVPERLLTALKWALWLHYRGEGDPKADAAKRAYDWCLSDRVTVLG